ncbi:hypothetical protein RclHR1_31870001 [Rhizophagus clarus]|uniref:Uncharacterized protein n=1 Tax=Rhizophagus clarus TaxID=94130 RepID=A0A2Z6R7D7_9GLOM|nr:hypothetical protein RclHR1_31870001 [Rhizophagus clarus]
MTRKNKSTKSWSKTKAKRNELRYKSTFWSKMYDIANKKRIGLSLELANSKRMIEDLNKKLKEVTNNLNEWKELYYHEVTAAEKWGYKFYIESAKK